MMIYWVNKRCDHHEQLQIIPMRKNYTLPGKLLLVLIWFPFILHAQNPGLDSLVLSLNNKNLNDGNRIRIYDNLSWGYLSEDAEKSVNYGNKGLRLARHANDKTMEATFLRNIGVGYYMLSVYDTAATYLHQALEIILEIDDTYLKGRLYTALGNLHNQQSEYPKALEYYLKSLATLENIGNQPLETVYNNIAVLYQNLQNKEHALIYFAKAKREAEKNQNKWILGSVAMAMSNYYMDKEPKKALEHAYEALVNFRAEGNAYHEILSILTIAQCHRRAGNPDEALPYAQQGLELAERSSFPKLIAEAEADLANIYYDRGIYTESLAHAKRSWDKDSTDFDLSAVMLSIMTRSNIHIGRTDSAIHWLDKYWDWTSTYSTEKYQGSLSEMQVKYETEKKALQIEALEKQQMLYIWIGILGAFLLLTAVAFFFLRHRLAEDKRKIAEQQVWQMQQEKQMASIQATLDGETAERSRLARDLHDGLGSMLSVVKFSLPEIKTGAMLEAVDVLRFNSALHLLDESIGELRRVAHHMMPESLLRYGLKASLSDFCDATPSVSFHYFGDEHRLPQQLETLIYRCVHELVNNALKHAQATEISVQLVQEDNRLSFTVQDDGIGFDPEAVQRGMGLQNIRQRIEAFGGVLHIYTAGTGTEINAEFELTNKSTTS